MEKIIITFMLVFLFVKSFAVPQECILIVKKLNPVSDGLLYSVKAYAKIQKDFSGSSTLEAPINAGIKLEVPLLDRKEKMILRQRYLQNLNKAQKLLSDYLATRYEVEEMKKYISWQWQRVNEGIEYKKDIWKQEIDLKKEEGKLVALSSLLQAAGINKNLLNKCFYKSFYGKDKKQ